MRAVPDKAVDLIKDFEKFRSYPYLCAGKVPTIGYGTTVYPDGERVTLSDPPCDHTSALQWLRNDVSGAAETVDRLVTVDIKENQFGALVSLVYNIGETNFKSSTLLKVLNEGDRWEAAAEFRWWRKSKGHVLLGLIRRRAAEVVLYWT